MYYYIKLVIVHVCMLIKYIFKNIPPEYIIVYPLYNLTRWVLLGGGGGLNSYVPCAKRKILPACSMDSCSFCTLAFYVLDLTLRQWVVYIGINFRLREQITLWMCLSANGFETRSNFTCSSPCRIGETWLFYNDVEKMLDILDINTSQWFRAKSRPTGKIQTHW